MSEHTEPEWIVEKLKQFNGVVAQIEVSHQKQIHWIDIWKERTCMLVEWRCGSGFGFFTGATYMVERATIVTTKEAALEHIIAFFGLPKR